MSTWLLAHVKFLEAGHASDWISGLIGAFGAIAGSLITVSWTELFNRRSRNRDIKSRQYAAAFSVFQKLNRIYSSALQIKDHFGSLVAECDPDNGPKCLSVRPMRSDLTDVHFTIEEKMGLWAACGPQMVNSIQALDASHNMLMQIVSGYDSERQKLMDALKPIEFSGPVGTLSEEDKKTYKPKFFELDFTIDQLLPFAKTNMSESFSAITALVQCKNKPLGKKFHITLPNPDGVRIELRASATSPQPWWHLPWQGKRA